MSTVAPEETQGLRSSLATLAACLHETVRTRLELLSLDLDEGRERITLLLLAVLGAMLAIGIGTLLAVAALLLAVSEAYRLPMLIGLAGISLLAGILGCLWVLQQMQATPSVFAATLAELERDRQQWRDEP